MTSRKEYELLFGLNAKLGNGYAKTFTDGQKKIADMQKQISALSKTQSDITAYQRQQKAAAETQKKLEMLQQQYENIQREMSETGEYSSDLTNKLLAKEARINKTTDALTTQSQKLDQMGQALHDAGVDTGDLGKASADLTAQIAAQKREQEAAAEQARNFGDSSVNAVQALEQAVVALGAMKAFKEIFGFFSDSANAAMLFESAMTGVEKTTDLTATELAAMSKEIKNMSTYIPMTAVELAAIAENAGQLGIYKENITGFMRTMADLGIATNLTGEDAAQTMAKYANITKMPQQNFERLGSTVVALGNNLATTERDIMSMALNLSSAAKQAGMTDAQILGIAGSLSSVGMEAQAGGTAFSKMINQITLAVETESNALLDFAEVAGMSARDFANAWKNDAASALITFTQGLADVDRLGASTVALLDGMGLTEARLSDSLRRAAGSGDLFERSIALGNKAWEENIALSAEAEKRYATTESKLVMMQNAYSNLQVAIGDVFNPTLKGVYETSTGVLKSITAFVEQNPGLVKAITVFVGTIGIATAALGAYTVAAKALSVVNKTMSGTFGPIMLGVTAVSGVISLFTFLASSAKDEVLALSAASQEQYYHMKELETEYQALCDAERETTAEAALLKKELDDVTTAFENTKQTEEEVARAHQDFIDAQREYVRQRDAELAAADKEGQTIVSLTNRLNDLVAVEGKTAAAKEQILSIVTILNEKMPELGLVYDQYSDSLNMTSDAIKNIALAEAYRLRNNETQQKLNAEAVNNITLMDRETAALRRKKAAERLVAKAESELAAASHTKEIMDDVEATHKLRDAEEDLVVLTNQHAEAKRLYDDSTKKIEEYSAAIGDYNQTQGAANKAAEETARVQAEIDAVLESAAPLIEDVATRVKTLTEAYNEAYTAAAESVYGQFALWDEAVHAASDANDDIKAISAAEFNAGITSQITYWQTYNSDLKKLEEQTSKIAGLQDMLNTFTDGSANSVNAVAGLANADEAELKKIVTDWQKLEKERKGVVSTLMSDEEQKYLEEMSGLESELQTLVNNMALGAEAYNSARETMAGYLSGIEDSLPAVERAFGELERMLSGDKAAARGWEYNGYDDRYGGRGYYYEGKNGSHAGGLTYVPFDGYMAELHRGEQVLTEGGLVGRELHRGGKTRHAERKLGGASHTRNKSRREESHLRHFPAYRCRGVV